MIKHKQPVRDEERIPSRAGVCFQEMKCGKTGKMTSVKSGRNIFFQKTEKGENPYFRHAKKKALYKSLPFLHPFRVGEGLESPPFPTRNGTPQNLSLVNQLTSDSVNGKLLIGESMEKSF